MTAEEKLEKIREIVVQAEETVRDADPHAQELVPRQALRWIRLVLGLDDAENAERYREALIEIVNRFPALWHGNPEAYSAVHPILDIAWKALGLLEEDTK